MDKDNLQNGLCSIYVEMCPNNFGRLIAYLTIVYQVADSCEEEIIREAVQRTVEDFKYIDLKNIFTITQILKSLKIRIIICTH